MKDGSEGRESVIVVHQQGEELWCSLNSDGSESIAFVNIKALYDVGFSAYS